MRETGGISTSGRCDENARAGLWKICGLCFERIFGQRKSSISSVKSRIVDAIEAEEYEKAEALQKLLDSSLAFKIDRQKTWLSPISWIFGSSAAIQAINAYINRQ